MQGVSDVCACVCVCVRVCVCVGFVYVCVCARIDLIEYCLTGSEAI